ncbi:hypothetical protein [Mycoplasmopsis glycophila]|uniref:hypothetical protein n=1 Tax=Mycoplasmopsis glycophila TaxID=171285 RepID=UPI000A04EEBD|nr:hypothetical protein [Mycoplasmopsis glycophila]
MATDNILLYLRQFASKKNYFFAEHEQFEHVQAWHVQETHEHDLFSLFDISVPPYSLTVSIITKSLFLC